MPQFNFVRKTWYNEEEGGTPIEASELNRMEEGIQEALESVPDISETEVTFEEATERTNIESGEAVGTIFGKIKKFFSDLKAVAFSGSYEDLDNKPSIPTVTNNDLATEAGTAWDAVRGAAIRADVDKLKVRFNDEVLAVYTYDDIPDNSMGYAWFGADIRPASGASMYTYICTGGYEGETIRRTVLAIDNNNNIMYRNTYNGTSWTGWQSIATESDTGWINLNYVTYRVKNGVCYITLRTGFTINIEAKKWTTLDTLPSQYAPSKLVYDTAPFGDTLNLVGGVQITTDGEIKVFVNQATTCGTFGASFPIK